MSSSAGWADIRLRHVVRVSPGVPLAGIAPDDAVSFLPLECVWPGTRLDMSRTRLFEEVSTGYTRFAEGDVVLPKITPTFQAGRAAVARGLRVGRPGFGTTELHVVRPGRAVDAGWLAYRFNSSDFLSQGRGSMLGVAGQQRVPPSFVKNFRVRLPSREVQARIVAFLDQETERPDLLASKKRQLLASLDEKERALIDAEVSGRGRTTPLMHLVDMNRPVMYGIVLPGPNVDDGVLLVKGGDVEADRLRPNVLSRTTRDIELPYARARLRERDLVVSIRGSFGALAQVPAALAGANITQDVARIAAGPGVDARWLYYALRSRAAFGQMAARATGATIRGVNIRDLKRVTLAVPSIDDQEAAVRRLDKASALHGEVRARLHEQLVLLAEHRRALITAAVSGDIDSADVSRSEVAAA